MSLNKQAEEIESVIKETKEILKEARRRAVDEVLLTIDIDASFHRCSNYEGKMKLSCYNDKGVPVNKAVARHASSKLLAFCDINMHFVLLCYCEL
ncbi:hypothetical protein OROMI_028830 [Orobanche minor]